MWDDEIDQPTREHTIDLQSADEYRAETLKFIQGSLAVSASEPKIKKVPAAAKFDYYEFPRHWRSSHPDLLAAAAPEILH
jgi:hypothetical protein